MRRTEEVIDRCRHTSSATRCDGSWIFGAQLVEVLPESEYQEDHLPGAISLPLRHIDTRATEVLDRDRAVIVYCWDTA
jgi:rhodanese-related sulfurtransferase